MVRFCEIVVSSKRTRRGPDLREVLLAGMATPEPDRKAGSETGDEEDYNPPDPTPSIPSRFFALAFVLSRPYRGNP
jgi:hypothetical protein